MIKLSDFVIRTIAQHGIDKCFMVYGSAIGDLVDAFTRTNGIQHICPQHEQGAGFMAEGWSKVTGKTAFCMATSGPGAMNLVTPIGNFWFDSVPGIFIVGNVKTPYMRQSEEVRQIGFQEAPVVDIVKPITKYAAQVLDPSRIRYELEKCLFLARDRRPGPVLLDLPIDVQQAQIEPEELEGFDVRQYLQQDPISTHYLVDEFVERYVDDLKKAERPVMLVGGGVRHAQEAFRNASGRLGIPIFPTYNAIDIVSSDLPHYGGRVGTYGGAGRNFAIQRSDLLLCVGTRLSGRISGGAPQTFAPQAEKYLVDVDTAMLKRENQQVPFDDVLDCDAGLFFRRLQAAIPEGTDWKNVSWLSRCIEWRDKYDPVAPHVAKPFEPLDPYLFVRELSRQAPANAIICVDCGGNLVISMHGFETKQGQRFFTNNGSSPMGFAFCGALGAAIADPSRPVICIIGDGGFQLNIQELQSMHKYHIHATIFVLNNGIYGITKQYQSVNFHGREIACGPDGYSVPDFVKVAAAYGIEAARVTDMGGAEVMFRHLGEPWIVDVQCPGFCTYEPKVTGWSTPIDKMTPAVDE